MYLCTGINTVRRVRLREQQQVQQRYGLHFEDEDGGKVW
jgi:hypothetical protein